MKKSVRFLALMAVATLLATGCATKKYVATQVEGAESRVETRLNERIDGVESQVEQNQVRLDDQERQIGEVSETARQALERAMEAGLLAEGKLLYETVLTDNDVRFGFDQASLSEDAKRALDEFAEGIKARNENVYIEIQGHTDAVGSEQYNLTLGERRAGAARDYLGQQHRIPLHRMSVISYGESAPLADNSTREGRATNRRVALVVLK